MTSPNDRVPGIRESRRFNVWDVFNVGGPPHIFPLPTVQQVHLFGETNVGNSVLTNVQVGNFISADSQDLVEHWYARTDVHLPALSVRQRALLDQWGSMTTVTFRVGEKPMWQRPLLELLLDKPWEPISIADRDLEPEDQVAARARVDQRTGEGNRTVVVEPRRKIEVIVNLHAKDACQRFVEEMDGTVMKIWIHLEGIATRVNG